MNLNVTLVPSQSASPLARPPSRNASGLAKPDGGDLCSAQVTIVVDVLRATSTIVTLLEGGVVRVYPIRSLQAARRLARQAHAILAGERNGIAVPGFDYGNSPFRMAGADLHGRSVVLATSNGTVVLNRVKSAPLVLVGCCLNATACSQAAVEEARRRGLDINIVCAGRLGQFALDDAVCAGYLVGTLSQTIQAHGLQPILSDSAQAAQQLLGSYPDIESAFRHSSSGKRVIEIGDEADIAFCSRIDVSQKAPALMASPDSAAIWIEDTK